MEAIFIKLLNMSISTGWLVLAIVFLRGILRKAPKSIHRFLWLLVGIKLLVPFSIESALSLVPSAQPINPEVVYTPNMEYVANIQETVDDFGQVKDVMVGLTQVQSQVTSRTTQKSIFVTVISGAWICGILAMVFYAAISMILLRRRVRTAVHMQENIWQSDFVKSPFILGVFRPRIYVPFHLNEHEQKYIIAHENMHLKHQDHMVKPIAFLLLSVYWFNPLIWLAYILLCRDIEFACDERVIKEMSVADKKGYSETLLSCSMTKRTMAVYPLAFGEVGIKTRIKSVLDYKKPKFWIVVVAILLCGVLAICFLTNPKEKAQDPDEIYSEKVDYYKINQFVADWATAFCERDGYYIAKHSTDKVQSNLVKKGLLEIEEDYYNFGWSSPWPMPSIQRYDVQWADECGAEINYYAWTSEPHITVWREILEFSCLDGVYYVADEKLIYLDNISTQIEFGCANPTGVLGLTMQYDLNGWGEVLNDAAKAADLAYYKDLFVPERAATILLNLADDPNKVQVTAEIIIENKVAQVKIYFAESSVPVEVTMIKPFGEDGIWIPKTRSCGDDAEEYFEQKDIESETEGENNQVLIDIMVPRDEDGFYAYRPNSAFWSDYETYIELLGENFLEEYYELAYTVEADISDSPGMEMIEIYTGNVGDGDSGFVFFKDASGKILHSEFAHNARAGWNNIYIGSVDGRDYILNLYDEDRYTYGEYGYAVFRLDESGNMEYISAEGMEWGSPEGYKYNDERFKEWAEELSYYMSNSYLLLSTQGGELRIENICEADKYNYETLKR